jgi:hypothetical protein
MESPKSCVLTFKTDYNFPVLNNFYAGKHWTQRKKIVNLAKKHFAEMFSILDSKNIPVFDYVTVEYHYSFKRRDCDGTIMAIKFFLDALKDKGVIVDDSPRWVKSVLLKYNESIPKNSQLFILNLLCH